MHGWPNPYTFTKAMGEMLLGHLKEDLQLIILRPTVILSTYKEPFPGWIEGMRYNIYIYAHTHPHLCKEE